MNSAYSGTKYARLWLMPRSWRNFSNSSWSEASSVSNCARGEVRAALQKAREWAKQTPWYSWRVERVAGRRAVRLVWVLKSLYWFLDDGGRRGRVASGLRRYGRRLDDVCRPVRV